MLVRTLIFFACAFALMAQSDTSAAGSEDSYSGPAILSRGETPANQNIAPIAFRPYVGVNGIYDTGLVPVGLTATGGIPTSDLYGVEANLGAYTYHVWKHTTLALDYRGDFRHYSTSSWDGTDQLVSLILTHQPTKRVTFTVREEGGTYSNNYFLGSTLGALDPNYLQLPQNDIYDNRVVFAGVSADLVYRLNHRLSFHVGGDGSLVRRQASALYGMTSGVARGDLEYRLSRHTTVGADYRFTYFEYTKGFGNSDIHSAGLNFSTQISRQLQFSARIGGARVESQSLTEVTLDPAVAALLGESVGIQAAYQLTYVPDMQARLTETLHHSQLSFAYADQVVPGNGVYLTSRSNTGSFNYSYTGIRHWNFGLNAMYGRMDALVQTIGAYSAYGGGFGVTRELGKGLHAVMRLDARHYDVAGGGLPTTTEYRTSVGLTYSPSDLPLVLW